MVPRESQTLHPQASNHASEASQKPPSDSQPERSLCNCQRDGDQPVEPVDPYLGGPRPPGSRSWKCPRPSPPPRPSCNNQGLSGHSYFLHRDIAADQKGDPSPSPFQPTRSKCQTLQKFSSGVWISPMYGNCFNIRRIPGKW